VTKNTFDEIYAAHFLYVRKFLLHLCNGNEYTADDLTQETFFQAYKSIHRFEGKCRIETWLCSIAFVSKYTLLRNIRLAWNFGKLRQSYLPQRAGKTQKHIRKGVWI